MSKDVKKKIIKIEESHGYIRKKVTSGIDPEFEKGFENQLKKLKKKFNKQCV